MLSRTENGGVLGLPTQEEQVLHHFHYSSFTPLLKTVFLRLNEKHLKLLTNFKHNSDSAQKLSSVEQMFRRKWPMAHSAGRVEAKQH